MLLILIGHLSAADLHRLLERADSISETGYYDLAAVVCEEALFVAENEVNTPDTTVAAILDRLGTYCYKHSAFYEAQKHFSRSHEIRRKALGESHPDIAASLYGLGVSYAGVAKNIEAESCFEQALAIRKAAFGPEHVSVAEVLTGLGNIRRDQLMIVAAESLFVDALQMYEDTLGSEHREVGDVMSMLATVYASQLRFDEAEEALDRAKAIMLLSLEADHPDMSPLYSAIAFVYATQGRLSEADSLADLSISITERARGRDHFELGRRCVIAGTIAVIDGNLDKAKCNFTRALDIYENTMGPNHPYTGRVLNTVANVYRQLGKHELADSLLDRSLVLIDETYGREGMDAAESKLYLATNNISRGRFAEADSLFAESLEIFETTFGPQHPDVAVILGNFGALRYCQGRYAEADELFDRAVDICDRSRGSGQRQLVSMLINLSNLRASQGRYEEGISTCNRALEMVEDAFGGEHPQASECLQTLASLYHKIGKYGLADTLANRALTLLKMTKGPDHYEVASVLNTRGMIAEREGRYEIAEEYFNHALSIFEDRLGSRHPNVAECLDNIAKLHALQGDFDKAQVLYERSLRIRQRSMGLNHPGYAGGLEAYADVLQATGLMDSSLAKRYEAFNIRKRSFEENGRFLTETDALAFSQLVRQSADQYISCYFDTQPDLEPSASGIAEVVLSSKGQVTDMVFERQRPFIVESDPKITELADSLRAVRYTLSSLFIDGPGISAANDYRDRIDSLQRISREIESELVRLSSNFSNYRSRTEPNMETVVNHLPENSVLLEYIRYNHVKPLSDIVQPRYAVAVFSSDTSPKILNLGDAESIDKSLSAYRSHMLHTSELANGPAVFEREDYRNLCSGLNEAIWKPVSSLVANKEMIFIAPDGGLNLLSFAGLLGEEDRYLVEDFMIHHISSGRDLIRFADDEQAGEGLFAIGDPDYNASIVDDLVTGVNQPSPIRSIRSSCTEFDNLNASSLPGTRVEVERIVDSWRNTSPDPISVFYGKDANEAVFKELAPGHATIHLATHGYFLGSSCLPDIPGQSNRLEAIIARENPLLLSGLLLAGANQVSSYESSTSAEDGVLTAFEVSSMDLSGTKLVVLSACESGLGEVKEGEGVYGLRRAFQVAGASTVVSALWPVSDEITSDMMGELFTKSDENLAQRIRNLQLKKIQELRNENKSDHPFNWGAFIALGDWRL